MHDHSITPPYRCPHSLRFPVHDNPVTPPCRRPDVILFPVPDCSVSALRTAGPMLHVSPVNDYFQTKVVVYGVLYGQSGDALAPQLGMSRPKAWKTQETVLKTYPRLTEFLGRVKADCKSCG